MTMACSMRRLIASCVLLLAVAIHSGTPAATNVSARADATGELELIILHNNDMHARFEQTGQHSNTCQPADVTGDRCYGGFARVSSKYAAPPP